MAYFAEQRRHDLYDEIIVSPHMDDAAYSMGGQIALLRRAGKKVLVVTLFGNGPDQPARPGKGTFDDYEARRSEERAAMAALDVDFIWLNLPELLFRKLAVGDVPRFAFPFWTLPAGTTHEALHDALAPIIAAHLAPGGHAVFPLAVGAHPDHRITYEVGVRLARSGRCRVAFYEDIPYAQCQPLRHVRVDELGAAGALSPVRAGYALNQFLFGRLKRLQWLTLFPMMGYAAALMTTAALTRQRRKNTTAPRLVAHEQPIDDVIGTKVAAMRCYPTQTAFFFTMDDGIYDLLREQGRYLERRWLPVE